MREIGNLSLGADAIRQRKYRARQRKEVAPAKSDPVAYYERKERHLWGQPGGDVAGSIGERWKWYGPCVACADCAKLYKSCRGIAGAVGGTVRCEKHITKT